MKGFRSSVLLLVTGLILASSGAAHADDLEIFGGAMASINPNVLIVFDTSSSMMCCTGATCSTPSNCSTLTDQRLYVAKI